jgi:hypothetical protein
VVPDDERAMHSLSWRRLPRSQRLTHRMPILCSLRESNKLAVSCATPNLSSALQLTRMVPRYPWNLMRLFHSHVPNPKEMPDDD